MSSRDGQVAPPPRARGNGGRESTRGSRSKPIWEPDPSRRKPNSFPNLNIIYVDDITRLFRWIKTIKEARSTLDEGLGTGVWQKLMPGIAKSFPLYDGLKASIKQMVFQKAQEVTFDYNKEPTDVIVRDHPRESKIEMEFLCYQFQEDEPELFWSEVLFEPFEWPLVNLYRPYEQLERDSLQHTLDQIRRVKKQNPEFRPQVVSLSQLGDPGQDPQTARRLQNRMRELGILDQSQEDLVKAPAPIPGREQPAAAAAPNGSSMVKKSAPPPPPAPRPTQASDGQGQRPPRRQHHDHDHDHDHGHHSRDRDHGHHDESRRHEPRRRA